MKPHLERIKIVLCVIIYVSFYRILFIILTTRSVKHDNSNKKRGMKVQWKSALEKTERDNLAIKGHWQHWTNKTPNEDEKERIKRRYQI